MSGLWSFAPEDLADRAPAPSAGRHGIEMMWVSVSIFNNALSLNFRCFSQSSLYFKCESGDTLRTLYTQLSVFCVLTLSERKEVWKCRSYKLKFLRLWLVNGDSSLEVGCQLCIKRSCESVPQYVTRGHSQHANCSHPSPDKLCVWWDPKILS